MIIKNKLCIFLTFFSLHSYGSEKIALEDLVKHVSHHNYVVLEEALKVYQAKQSIQVARSELLPSLNLWKLVNTVSNPITILSVMTEDLVPFLVPSNWFRLEQTKSLYQAEKEGYRALWANELLQAKLLFFQILQDQDLYSILQETHEYLLNLQNIAEKKEKFGALKQQISRELKIKTLSLEEDLFRLSQLIEDEKKHLAFVLGKNLDDDFELQRTELPNLELLNPLKTSSYHWRVQSASPEKIQHQYFLEALKYIKEEVHFSFLGSSQTSRGVAGGIFDHLPMPAGLGFSRAPSLKIHHLEKQRFLVQLKGIEETLSRNLSTIVLQHNLELQTYQSLKEREQLSKESLDLLKKQLYFIGDVNFLLLSEVVKNYLSTKTSLLTSRYRVLQAQEKLSRLAFHHDYDSKNMTLEQVNYDQK